MQIKIVFVDSLSVDNLALYDAELLKGMLCGKTEVDIRFYGTVRFNQKLPENILYQPLYRYCGHWFLHKGFSYLFSHLKLIRVLLRNKPDIVHMQWFRLPPVDLLLLFLMRRLLPDTRFVHTAHNVRPHEASQAAEVIWRQIYNQFDNIIVHEEQARREIIEEMQQKEDKIHIIPHGPLKFPVDREELQRRIIRLSERIRSTQPAGSAFVPIISFLGYLRTYKGLELLIEILADSSLRKRIRILIAGEGSIKSESLLRSWPELTLINEKMDNLDFLSCLHVSDLVILPYRAISQSGLLMTAVAEGIPSLVSPAGGMPGVIEKYNAGWVMDEMTADSLHKSLERLLDDPDMLQNKKLAMQSGVDAKVEWKNIAALTMKLYLDSMNAGQFRSVGK